MKAINLDTYSLSLLTAKEDILNPRSSTNWALFNYDGATNNLKLCDSGAGGLSELAGKFHTNRPLYGLCRMAPQESAQRRIVLIAWVGEGVGERRSAECTSHIPAIKAFFKEANAFITANSLDDVTEEKINTIVSKTGVPPERMKRGPRAVEKEETVGTNYRKTNAAMEMHRINRESFWARAEREEEERKEEDRRRATEDRRRHEKERILQERREADERERKMDEKLQLIEEQRRLQAKQDAETRKLEKSKWEQQQREFEDDMRARFRRSESIEKAAEAAALVSQRSLNPREFFRQLSSSSTSPVSPRTVKPPFRRYQRSLTDTAFIFGRADAPSSPRSPPLGSPFSRTPTSPFPFPKPKSPTSPTFLPSVSPQHSPAPQPSPPASSSPTLPSPKLHPPTSPQSDSPSRPTAPSQPLPLSPAAPPTGPLAGLDSPPRGEAPTAPLPETPAVPSLEPNEVYVATRMLSDLETEADLMVQAVLADTSIAPVAEEEEEEEARTLERKATEEVPADEKEAVTACAGEEGTSALSSPPGQSMEGAVTAVLVMATEVSDEVDPGQEEDPTVDDREEAAKPASESSVCAPTLVEQAEEEEEPEAVSHPGQGPIRTEQATGAVDMTQEEAVLPTNGMSAEEDIIEPAVQNGTERSPSPSETDLSPCVPRHDGMGDDIITENTENGEEVSLDGQLCVRALYDYQAEDESELSLEPGDIISAVETVDKAWWRGYSKDGRQGLFPANYVETI